MPTTRVHVQVMGYLYQSYVLHDKYSCVNSGPLVSICHMSSPIMEPIQTIIPVKAIG
jgi:hypothetical protein